jgi:hypothetical protein
MKIRKYFMLIGILICFTQCQEEELGDLRKNEEISQSNSATSKSASNAGQFSILTYNIAGLPQFLSSATNRDIYTPI